MRLMVAMEVIMNEEKGVGEGPGLLLHRKEGINKPPSLRTTSEAPLVAG